MTVPANHPSKTDRPGWARLRTAVLERESNKCKRCRAPNRVLISRAVDEPGRYMTYDGQVFGPDGQYEGMARGSEWGSPHMAQVVLTIAHLNDDDGPCRCDPPCLLPDHVEALCQRCHNLLDAPRRRRNAARTRRSKGGQATLPGIDP